MTQEEKINLVLKDICGRLPYGVITKNCKNNFDVPAHFLPDVNGIKQLITECDLKPYLRPMSSMTEEELSEYRAACRYHNIKGTVVYEDTYKSLDWLNKKHFDYRGLIPMGLALEAPKGMYNV